MKKMIDETKKGKSNTRREFIRNSALVAAGLNFAPDTIIGNVFSKPLYSGSLSRSMNYPVRLGLNDGSISTRWTTSETKNRFFKILDQLGLNHVDLHLRPIFHEDPVPWITDGGWNCVQNYGLGIWWGKDNNILVNAFEKNNPTGMEEALQNYRDRVVAEGDVLYIGADTRIKEPSKYHLYVAFA